MGLRKEEISALTGKAKIVRKGDKKGKAAALRQTTMTKEQWKGYQTKYKSSWAVPEYMTQPREAKFVRDGGDGAYRIETYEIVTRWMAETKIEYRPHAKAPGSKSHVRYEKYSQAKTVGQALKLGSWPMDWCYDYEHGFIKVKGPVRPEPIDPSKLGANQKMNDVDAAISQWYRKELAKRYNLDLKELAHQSGSGESIIMRAHRLVCERKCAAFLKAADKEKRSITDAEVSEAMATWAFAKNPNRQNVLPDGQDWVWSDTIGLIRDRIGDIHIVTSTLRYPSFVKIFTRFLADRIPPEVDTFKYTSLNLNCNYAAKRHRDGNNFGPSFIKAFGDFTGGELSNWPDDERDTCKLEKLPEKDRRVVNLSKNLCMFNGNCGHEVSDFEGNRYSVVYFTAGCHAKAKEADIAKLREMGFPYPEPDEDPRALLAAPSGYDSKKISKRGPDSKPKFYTWNSDVLAKRKIRRGFAPPKRSKMVQIKQAKGKKQRGGA